MKRIIKNLGLIIITLIICQIYSFALVWYDKEPGKWTETGPNYAFGDHIDADIRYRVDIYGKKWVISYEIECWGNPLITCFVRTTDQIGVALLGPPIQGDTLNATVTGVWDGE